MTTSEIQNIKLDLVKSIINIDNEDSLKEISGLVKRLLTEHPCMYTPEEIWSGADSVIKAHREGDRSQFVSFKDIKKKTFA